MDSDNEVGDDYIDGARLHIGSQTFANIGSFESTQLARCDVCTGTNLTLDRTGVWTCTDCGAQNRNILLQVHEDDLLDDEEGESKQSRSLRKIGIEGTGLRLEAEAKESPFVADVKLATFTVLRLFHRLLLLQASALVQRCGCHASLVQRVNRIWFSLLAKWRAQGWGERDIRLYLNSTLLTSLWQRRPPVKAVTLTTPRAINGYDRARRILAYLHIKHVEENLPKDAPESYVQEVKEALRLAEDEIISWGTTATKKSLDVSTKEEVAKVASHLYEKTDIPESDLQEGIEWIAPAHLSIFDSLAILAVALRMNREPISVSQLVQLCDTEVIPFRRLAQSHEFLSTPFRFVSPLDKMPEIIENPEVPSTVTSPGDLYSLNKVTLKGTVEIAERLIGQHISSLLEVPTVLGLELAEASIRHQRRLVQARATMAVSMKHEVGPLGVRYTYEGPVELIGDIIIRSYPLRQFFFNESSVSGFTPVPRTAHKKREVDRCKLATLITCKTPSYECSLNVMDRAHQLVQLLALPFPKAFKPRMRGPRIPSHLSVNEGCLFDPRHYAHSWVSLLPIILPMNSESKIALRNSFLPPSFHEANAALSSLMAQACESLALKRRLYAQKLAQARSNKQEPPPPPRLELPPVIESTAKAICSMYTGVASGLKSHRPSVGAVAIRSLPSPRYSTNRKPGPRSPRTSAHKPSSRSSNGVSISMNIKESSSSSGSSASSTSGSISTSASNADLPVQSVAPISPRLPDAMPDLEAVHDTDAVDAEFPTLRTEVDVAAEPLRDATRQQFVEALRESAKLQQKYLEEFYSPPTGVVAGFLPPHYRTDNPFHKTAATSAAPLALMMRGSQALGLPTARLIGAITSLHNILSAPGIFDPENPTKVSYFAEIVRSGKPAYVPDYAAISHEPTGLLRSGLDVSQVALQRCFTPADAAAIVLIAAMLFFEPLDWEQFLDKRGRAGSTGGLGSVESGNVKSKLRQALRRLELARKYAPWVLPLRLRYPGEIQLHDVMNHPMFSIPPKAFIGVISQTVPGNIPFGPTSKEEVMKFSQQAMMKRLMAAAKANFEKQLAQELNDETGLPSDEQIEKWLLSEKDELSAAERRIHAMSREVGLALPDDPNRAFFVTEQASTLVAWSRSIRCGSCLELEQFLNEVEQDWETALSSKLRMAEGKESKEFSATQDTPAGTKPGPPQEGFLNFVVNPQDAYPRDKFPQEANRTLSEAWQRFVVAFSRLPSKASGYGARVERLLQRAVQHIQHEATAEPHSATTTRKRKPDSTKGNRKAEGRKGNSSTEHNEEEEESQDESQSASEDEPRSEDSEDERRDTKSDVSDDDDDSESEEIQQLKEELLSIRPQASADSTQAGIGIEEMNEKSLSRVERSLAFARRLEKALQALKPVPFLQFSTLLGPPSAHELEEGEGTEDDDDESKQRGLDDGEDCRPLGAVDGEHTPATPSPLPNSGKDGVASKSMISATAVPISPSPHTADASPLTPRSKDRRKLDQFDYSFHYRDYIGLELRDQPTLPRPHRRVIYSASDRDFMNHSMHLLAAAAARTFGCSYPELRSHYRNVLKYLHEAVGPARQVYEPGSRQLRPDFRL